MKNKGIQRVITGLLLVIWMGTFYPGTLFHSHETEIHECHLNCVASEEEAGVHNECDHEIHIHDEIVPCFLCEFTLAKVYIGSNLEFLDIEFRSNTYRVSHSDSDVLYFVENLTIRGPPAFS